MARAPKTEEEDHGRLIERAEQLAHDLGRGHYSMPTAISMIRELAKALRKSRRSK